LAGVGERTFWRWSRSGLAPAPIFIGNGPRPAVRYRRSEILRWIDNGCQPCHEAERGAG
jgi:predicted DNA-binding transcriptional regulator AlpA